VKRSRWPWYILRALSALGLTLALGASSSFYRPTDEQLQTATRLLHSGNPHLFANAYIISAAIWKKTTIPVCWENPDVQYQSDMSMVRQEVADTWMKASRLNFTGWQKCTQPKNDGIRILIRDAGAESLYVGKFLDGIPNGLVMNFAFVNWNTGCSRQKATCIKAIAGHEFGHALGLVHEENAYNIPGECNLEKIAPYGDKPLTPYDPSSVMNTCSLKYMNNGQLSDCDVDAARQLYGSPNGSEPVSCKATGA
jgi:hypothetical protein